MSKEKVTWDNYPGVRVVSIQIWKFAFIYTNNSHWLRDLLSNVLGRKGDIWIFKKWEGKLDTTGEAKND